MTPGPAQLAVDLEPVAGATGTVVLAGAVAAVIAVAHRWYARSRVPEGLAVLAGASAAALVLNTTAALGSVLGGAGISVGAALANVVTFVAAGVVGSAGARVGDRIGVAAFSREADVGRLVASVGRTTTIELPEEIEDMPEHDPVPADVKANLAGREFRFPRRLTVEELRERLRERLRADYGVGRIDVDFDDGGRITYLAIGSRVAGLGPTLSTGTAAVAVRADPAAAASAGDLVEVWAPTDDGSGAEVAGDAAPRWIASGEIRGVAGDVVTLALDAADATALDDRTRYRLLTLPGEVRADRAFAGVLRAAEETMAVVTVAEGSPLVGTTVGNVTPGVVAVRAGDGTVVAIPPRSRSLAAGEAIYLVARPDEIRRIEIEESED